jgi:hypothetical protein
VQELKLRNFLTHKSFCQDMGTEMGCDVIHILWMSGAAYFHLDHSVNEQNWVRRKSSPSPSAIIAQRLGNDMVCSFI